MEKQEIQQENYQQQMDIQQEFILAVGLLITNVYSLLLLIKLVKFGILKMVKLLLLSLLVIL